jgi:hypothetical protein
LNRYAPTNAGDETKVIVKRLRLINKGKMRANFYNAEKLLSYPENADDSLPPRKRFSSSGSHRETGRMLLGDRYF